MISQENAKNITHPQNISDEKIFITNHINWKICIQTSCIFNKSLSMSSLQLNEKTSLHPCQAKSDISQFKSVHSSQKFRGGHGWDDSENPKVKKLCN